MTKNLSIFEQARDDAKALHKKIGANIAKAEASTWADIKATQADIMALTTRMKALAEDQTDAVQAGIKSAISKMETAGKLVEAKAGDAMDGVKHANASLLDSAHRAAQSLKHTVAAANNKTAKAIAPKPDAKETCCPPKI